MGGDCAVESGGPVDPAGENAHLALKLVDYVHVKSKGQVVYSGELEALRVDEAVKSNCLRI